jgi:RNA polymerase sigma-70 factor, ECF subfamily
MESMDFGVIYERYAADVLRFALYLSGNRGEAEEIAAETFVRAWVATGGIRVATVKAYLFSIARNLYVERLRRRGREGEMPRDVRDLAPGPDAAAEGRAQLAAVMAALHAMPEIDRTAVLMRAGDLPYEEIARALGITAAAARVKVHRARLKLAALGLSPLQPAEDRT